MYAIAFDMVISDLQKYYGEPYNKAYYEIKELLKKAQVRKSVDSPPGMLTEDHHHTVHEESQVCYSSHLRPKSLHL